MSTEHDFNGGTIWQREQQTHDDMQEFVERRAVIEQAKGMLMFVYGIDADEAFDILRSQSQQHNVKLQLVVEQVVKDLVELAKNKDPARRVAFDEVLRTAQQRISNAGPRQLDGESKTGVPMKDL
jgi:hypothetical protein